MKVLIATDDAPASWDAIEFASRLLGDDDEIVVVNVAAALTTPMLVPAGGLVGYSAGAHLAAPPSWWAAEEGTDGQRDHAEDVAERAAETVDADRAIAEQGDPVDRIVAMAEKHVVDLVIAGTRDASLLERIFLGGSVSRDLVDKAPCSVLIVR